MTKDQLLDMWAKAEGKEKIFFHTHFKNWLDQQPDTSLEGQKLPQDGLRTDNQHNALFLWFSMIEHEAGNAGITWNQVVGKTHQLKITKEGLHVMAKQLAEALWGIKSTKLLKKQGHIDDLVDHFTDLFAKVGLELPPFPEDQNKGKDKLQGITKARELDYPADPYEGQKVADFGEDVVN